MGNTLFDGLLENTKADARFSELPDGRFYTYQDVVNVSGKFANALVALGVKPGDRVAVQVPKSIEALMLYLGTVRAGAVFLPLNTGYMPAEIEYFVSDASPALLVCDPEKASGYKELANRLGVGLETLGVWTEPGCSAGTLLDYVEKASPDFNNIDRDPADLAAILYTSGTTGRSKGAMLSHENLLSNALTLKEYWQFTANDVLLHALPIFHTHGLFVATNTVLVSGASMIFLPGFSNDQVIEYLPKATAMMGVPTFYTRLLDDQRFNRDLVQHMRLFVSGSAPLLAETHQQFEERTGHRILERYVIS